MTESYRCIGWTRMYYIQGRTKPEDKFIIYGLKSHTILSITPTEFKSGKWNVINLVKTARDTVKCLDPKGKKGNKLSSRMLIATIPKENICVEKFDNIIIGLITCVNLF